MREWGPELWDAVDKVENRISDRVAKNSRAIKFLQEKCSIDMEYSKQMKRLVTKFQKMTPSDSEVTIDRAFIGMVSETHDIANQYEQICEEIMSDCIQPLTGFNQELTTTKKELFTEYKRHCRTLEDMDKDAEKSKLSWERKCRDYEKAKINFDKADQDQNVTKADVEKARANSHQRRQIAEDGKNEYANRLVKYNEQQKSHHYELVPTILNNYQNTYMKNIEEFRLTIQKYCAAEDKYRPLIGKCISEIGSKSEEINKEKDSEYIIDTLKTGYTPPDDKQFENMEAEVHNPKTQKRKTFGGLFHTKTESKPPKEDMSHLPPHMRKRALQKMQKDAEKDVEKVEKELAAVNKMSQIDKFGDVDQVSASIKDAETRLDRARSQLNKVNGWLGETSKNSPVHSRKPVDASNPMPPPPSSTFHSASQVQPKYASPISVSKRNDSFDIDSDDGGDNPVLADCLYDFTEDGEGCLSITQGMSLIVTEEDTGDGWTKVKIPTTGREGFVPTSYISLR